DQVLGQNAIAFSTVEVVGIDDCEWLFDDVGRHQHRLRRSPWLAASRGNGETLWKLVEFLKRILNRNPVLEPGADRLPEGLFDVFADDEYQLPEAGTHGVID